MELFFLFFCLGKRQANSEMNTVLARPVTPDKSYFMTCVWSEFETTLPVKNASLRQSVLSLVYWFPENVLKCKYFEANFVFLHVQMLFWISDKLKLFYSLHYVIRGSFKPFNVLLSLLAPKCCFFYIYFHENTSVICSDVIKRAYPNAIAADSL